MSVAPPLPVPDRVLELAVDKALITAGQAAAIRSLARQEAPADRREPLPDPEALRFVSGFADIFVTIGLVMFFGSAGYLMGRSVPTAVTGLAMAGASWALAEYFTRRRRMALPSITLLLVFAIASFVALAGLLGSGREDLQLGWISTFVRFDGANPIASASAALLTAGLCAIHYARFRVPVTVAAGTAALLVAALLAFYAASPAATLRSVNLLLFVSGITAFVLAMRFDLSDPARTTRRTDIAFWLHLLAAPLIVHSLFTGLGLTRGLISPVSAVAILVLFVVLAAVAIAVDRRAILVSGLAYAGAAFGALIARVGFSERTVPVTLLVLGALVLLLSAGWQPLRQRLLATLPGGLGERLPRSSAS